MPNLYLMGFVVVIALAFWGDYNYTQSQNAKLKTALSDEVSKNERLIAQKQSQAILQAANAEASRVLNDSQIQSEVDKERRTDKANEHTIAATAQRNAEKYTGFTERVMEKNVEVIQCKSDYRKIHDEANPCLGHVR